MASLLGATLALGGLTVGGAQSASAVVPDVINEPPLVPTVVNVFPNRDFVSASGFAATSLVDVEVWRGGVLAGFVNDVTPVDVPATAGFDGLVEVNHPGGACWTTSTPDIRAGDQVRLVEKTGVSNIAQQTTVRDLAVTTAAREIQPGVVEVRGTIDPAIALADVVHEFVGSTGDPFDFNGTRRISADVLGPGTGKFAAGSLSLDQTDPTGSHWVAIYTGLTPADVNRIMRATGPAASNIAWTNPGLTESTSAEFGLINGPQAPCTAPAAGPAATATASVVFPATATNVLAASAPTQTVTFTNAGHDPFGALNVSGLTTTGDYSVLSQTCTGAPIAVGGTCAATVRFLPTATGRRAGTLVLNSDSVGGPLTVGLVGFGFDAAGVATPFLDPTPVSVDFGTRQVGLLSPATAVVIRNLGNAAAVLGNPTITGVNAADFSVAAGNTCVGTLAIGASCTISLTFAPGAELSRTATLTLATTGSTATIALQGAGLQTTTLFDPPGPGKFIGSFMTRDFVTTTGFTPGLPITVQVVRHNVVIGQSQPLIPDATGLAEVNHPGGGCWAGTTPNLRAGDLVRVVDSTGAVHQSFLGDVSITAAPALVAPGTVEIHGRAATPDNTPLSIDTLAAELITSTANPFDLNGRRIIAAPGDGTLAFDAVDPVTNPDGVNWTATFSGLTPADVNRALNIALADVNWLGRQPTALNEQTFYELGNVDGPQAPCTSPAAAPDADVKATPQAVTFASRQAPRVGFAGTSSSSIVTVKSTGLIPLVITGVTFAGTNATDFSQTVAATNSCTLNTPIPVGSSCNLQVQFSPAAVGARTGDLQILTNVVGTPTHIALAGKGLAAAAAFATVSSLVNFPERGVGLQAVVSLPVHNDGEANLSIPTTAITGTNAADFSVISSTCTNVAPTLSCAISLGFRPAAVGTRTATLTLTQADPAQGPIAVSLVGTSLTNGGFSDPPAVPRSIIAFPVRDFVHAQGFLPTDNVVVQVVRGTTVIGESAPAAPIDDPLTPNVFDGIVEVNHAGGVCWAGSTPDIQSGDLVRTVATDALGHVLVRNGISVQDQTPVQDIVVTQTAVNTATGTVVVKGYARDVRNVGQRIDIGQLEVRLVALGTALFERNGKRALRADAAGQLDGTIAYDGLTDMFTATFSGLTAADVATATLTSTQNVGLWLGRNPLAVNEGTQYEWGEIAGGGAPCNAAPFTVPFNTGVGTVTPAMPLIAGEGGLLDLGIVAATGASPSSTLTLTNSGNRAMTISSVVTNLGLDTTNFKVATGGDGCTGRTLNAGASCTLAIQFAPAASATVGVHWGSVQIYSTGASSPHQAILRAEVPAVPVITSFTPAGSARTNLVTVTGTGLSNITSVSLVGTNARATIGRVVAVTTFTPSADGTSLTFRVPAGAVINGTYTIRVVTVGGTANSATTLLVLPNPATVTSFAPNRGIVGTTVTITGTNFTDGLVPATSVVTAVKFGGVNATSFTVVNDTTITAVVAAGSADGPITVTTAAGTAGSTAAFDFVGLPTVTAVTPNPARARDVVTITGVDFVNVSSITLNGTAIAGATVNLAGTAITFTVPAAATQGILQITALGGIGQSNLLVIAANPTITSFTPTSAGAGQVVTITGRNFLTTQSVTMGAAAANAVFTIVDANTLRVTVPTNAATGKITVRTSFGSVASGANFTFIPAPTITSFTPLTGPSTGGTRITITGTNLATATSVTVGGKVVTTFATRTATSLVFTTVTGMTKGLSRITVVTSGGTAVSAASFTVV